MNNVFQQHAISATATAAAAIMGASDVGQVPRPEQGSWVEKMPPAYVTSHSERTFSDFEKKIIFIEPTSAQIIGRRIAAVYAVLSEGQEPLGAEFEAVWDENLDQLYES